MDIDDVSLENFFKRITFASDPTPGAKLVIPNPDFIADAIKLRLIITIENLISQLEKNRVSAK